MRKIFSLFIPFIIVFTIQINAQSFDIVWSKGADFPLPLSEIKAISCNEKIYVIGGKITKDNTDLSDNEDVDYTFEYDPQKNIWSKKSCMPSRRYDVALAIVDNKIYAISSKNEVYDPVTDKWQIASPLPGGMAHVEAVSLNKKIYVCGSEEGIYKKTMMYDPQTDVWMEKKSIPTPRLAPTVVCFENKIFVIGGIGFNSDNQLGVLLQNIEVYDPENDHWEVKKPMPKSLWGAEGVFVKDDQIYFINTRSNGNISEHNIYAYNPKEETWIPVKNNLPKCYSEQGVAFFNDRIYVIGGYDNSFFQSSDVFIGEFIRNNQ